MSSETTRDELDVDWGLQRDGVAMVSAELELLNESDPVAAHLIEEIRRLLDALRQRYSYLSGEQGAE